MRQPHKLSVFQIFPVQPWRACQSLMAFLIRTWDARLASVIAAGMLLLLSPIMATRADAALPVTGKSNISRKIILKSIERGTRYLLKQEKPGTFWETASPTDVQWGGQTALALYALMEVGQTTGDPLLQRDSARIAPAFHWLEKLKPQSTYAASLQISALTAVPSNSVIAQVALSRATRYLIQSQHPGGGYHYKLHPKPLTGIWDNSNSQYGLLGVWAANLGGMAVPSLYWVRAQKHWRSSQNVDGGWSYQSSPQSTRAMTAAGLTSLYVVDEYLHNGVHLHARVDKNIAAGMAWLAKNIKTNKNMYYLYGVERVGLAGGIKRIGKVDWYRQGAREILRRQNATTGGWDEYVLASPSSSVPTAYALLFLTRGLNPVVFEKLAYQGNWNPRPRDDANVTQWIGSQFEEPLNWSIVNIHSNPEHWLSAPVLLITGSSDPHFSQHDIARFRTFVNNGGMIFSVAVGGSTTFTTAVENAATALTNGIDHMVPLGASTAIRHVQFALPNTMPLMGLSNGVRYLWIHTPMDTSAAWQSMDLRHSVEAFNLAANLYFYATGKHRLIARLHPLKLPSPKGTPVREVHMAMLTLGENWNPEPDAWPRFARVMRVEHHTALILKNEPLANLNLKETPIAHLTGTGRFHVSWQLEGKLHAYLSHGGTLFADAAGGSPAFRRSFESMVLDMYPTQSLVPINLSSAMYSGTLKDSINTTHVLYRRSFIQQHGYSTQPRLLGIRRHGRWVIIFSPQDITSELLGLHTWGIDGYQPKSAQALAADIILYAVHNEKVRH